MSALTGYARCQSTHLEPDRCAQERRAGILAAIALLFAVFLAFIPHTAWAYAAGETFVENVEVIADDGTTSQVPCTFKKTNAFMVQVGDGSQCAVPLQTKGTVVIPDQIDGSPVRTVAASAFGSAAMAQACVGLTGVALPDTVQTIGDYAFAHCSSLRILSVGADGALSEALSSGVRSIGSYSFYYCTALSQLKVPAGVTTVGDYAFSRCTALKTVEFLGDAPKTVGASAFAGGGVCIEGVIYRGASIPRTDALFNSETAGDPVFYYAVYFYDSLSDYRAGKMRSAALLREGIEPFKISFPHEVAPFCAEGAIPAFPAGTNYWQPVEDIVEEAPLATALHVYAVASDFDDLGASAQLTAKVADASGNERYVSSLGYTGYPLVFQCEVRNGIGAFLTEGEDYVLSFQRQSSDGAWVETTDMTSFGTLRVVATAVGPSYKGSVVRDFEIDIEGGTIFRAPVTGYRDGVPTTVYAHFRPANITPALSAGTVAISSPPAGTGSTLCTVRPAFEGGCVAFPAQLELENGRKLSVTSVATGALRMGEEAGYVLPETVASLEKWSVATTGALAFLGDTHQVQFGTEAVLAVGRVLFFGSVAQNYETVFGSAPRYYGISFYESLDAYNRGDAPLQRAAVSPDVQLMEIPTLTPDNVRLFSWNPIEYPASAAGDGVWTGPYWAYPQVDKDALSAMTKTLTAGTYAVADLTNDILSVDWCHVSGLKEGQKFGCSGDPVIDASEIKVYAHHGGLLQPGVDYTISYERYNQADDKWEPTKDVASFGECRLVVQGVSPRYGTQKIAFSITAVASNMGTQFTASIPVVGDDGSVMQTPAVFQVTGANTCTMIRPDGARGSFANGLSGSLSIPARVQYLGWTYAVTQISSYALGADCPDLDVIVPDTIASCDRIIGKFRSLKLPLSLVKFNTSSGLELLPSYTIAGGAIGTLVLPEGLKGIGGSAIASCAIQELVLPESLEYLSTFAFSDSSVDEFTLTTDWPFTSLGGLQPRRLIVEEGITELPRSLLNGATATKAVELPSTLQTIGDRVFYGSGVEEISLPEGLVSIGSDAFTGSSLKSITIPASVQRIGSNAFGPLSTWLGPKDDNLQEIFFAGDANQISMDDAFANAAGIKSVAWLGRPSENPDELFSASDPKYYYGVTFYDDEASYEAGEACGFAAVREGTKYGSIADSLSAVNVIGGAIPAFVEPANRWWFAHGPHATDGLDRASVAWGIQADALDLAQASLSFAGATDGIFPYTGDSYDVVGTEASEFRNVEGELISFNEVVWRYERMNAESGQWEETDDIASCGIVRVVVEPADSSSYHGTLEAWMTITRYSEGAYFASQDGYGNWLTYCIISVPGRGQNGQVALVSCENASGTVAPSSVVNDRDGLAYDLVRIDEQAAYRCTAITEFKVPASVRVIGPRAFAYRYATGDIAESQLKTIWFEGDVDDVSISADAFDGCEELANIVYGGKKGSFRSFGPNSSWLIHWYTATYYADKASWSAGAAPLSQVVLREGSYIDSPSATAYWPGYSSDDIPVLDDDHIWRYETGTVSSWGMMEDSLWAFARITDNAVFTDEVTLIAADGTESRVECLFRPVLDEDGEYLGGALVGTGAASSPAVSPSVAQGTIRVPAEVHDASGRAFEVAGVDAFAFGSDGIDAACEGLVAIELPSTVQTIGQGAFAGCGNLEQVAWAGEGAEPCALRTIGASAFADCASLRSVDLPEGLRSINGSAFARTAVKAVRLPFTLETLGRNAFSGCSELVEVVFSGPKRLELPALDGLDGDANAAGEAPALRVDQDGCLSDAMPLAVVSDYAFSDCGSLLRVVFEADASATDLSPQAFDGDEKLADVVFGSGMAAELDTVFAESVSLWCTVTYYASYEAYQQFEPLGYAVVSPSAAFEAMEDEACYAGAPCELEADHEWAGLFDLAAPLGNSRSVWMTQSLFDIDCDTFADAFEVTSAVAGTAATRAAYGDDVVVAVASSGSWIPTHMVVHNQKTGEVIAECFNESSLSFTMPQAAVAVSVEGDVRLPVYRQALSGNVSLVGELSAEDLRSLAASGATRYSAFDDAFGLQTMATEEAAPLSSVLEAVGLKLEGGESIEFKTTKGSSFTFGLDALLADRKYYPFAFDRKEDGAQAAPAALALSCAMDGGLSSRATTLRLLYGQTLEEMVMQRATYGNFASGIAAITVIESFADVAKGSIAGLEESYSWTGDAIKPEPMVYDAAGSLLQRGRDYDLRWSDNVEAGLGTVTAVGEGLYKGEISVNFRIVRAMEVAGAGSAGTVAQAALEAYPKGSTGAVVVAAEHAADSLIGSALAQSCDWPVLIVSKNAVPTATEEALRVLSQGNASFRVVMLGGTSWMSDAVKDRIGQVVGRAQNVMRLSASSSQALSNLVGEYGEGLGVWNAATFNTFSSYVARGTKGLELLTAACASADATGSAYLSASTNAAETMAAASLAHASAGRLLAVISDAGEMRTTLAGWASDLHTIGFVGDGASLAAGVRSAALQAVGWDANAFSDVVAARIRPALPDVVLVETPAQIASQPNTGTASSTAPATKPAAPSAATLAFKAKKLTKTFGAKAFSYKLTKAVTDGKITYSSSNKKVATVSSTGKITLKGVGTCVITAKSAATSRYKAASAKVTLTVKPAKQKIAKLTKAKKAFTVKWKKAANASGYQVQYATNKSFTKGKVTKKVSKKKISLKVSKLTSKKTYWVRVRTYVKTGGKTYYGAWSSPKSVKVK